MRSIDDGNFEEEEWFSAEDESDRDDMEHLDKENRPPNFNVPNELLIKILEMVPMSQWASLESVSHQFQEVVHGFWGQLHEIQLDELVYNKGKKPYQIVDAVLKKFLIRAPNITSISGFDDIGLPKIRLLSKFKHLQTIDFSGGKVITASAFAAFLVLSASRQSWKSLNIVDGIYGNLKWHSAVDSKNQPSLNLECFEFSMEKLRIFERFLPPIDWSRLKKLDIAGSSVSAKQVLWIIRQCKQVVHLEIRVPECGNGKGQPSYAVFMQAVADLENLSVLKVYGYYSSPDQAFHDALLVLIQDLGRRRREITDLALLVSDICSDEMVETIIDHLPHLKSLELKLSYIWTTVLQRLSDEMDQLVSLTLLSTDHSVDGYDVRAIGCNMRNLQCLFLRYPVCYSDDYATLGNLQKLKELCVLGGCLGSQTIEDWIRMGFGECLEKLTIETDYISAEAMGDFLKTLPRLRRLGLKNITDAFVYAIAESCPNLVVLNLWDSPTITSTGIQSIIDRCSKLKVLNVTGHDEWFPCALTVGKYRRITFYE